jgi:hypothetical protein
MIWTRKPFKGLKQDPQARFCRGDTRNNKIFSIRKLIQMTNIKLRFMYIFSQILFSDLNMSSGKKKGIQCACCGSDCYER